MIEAFPGNTLVPDGLYGHALEYDEEGEEKAVKTDPGDCRDGGDTEPALRKDSEEEEEEGDFGEALRADIENLSGVEQL